MTKMVWSCWISWKPKGVDKLITLHLKCKQQFVNVTTPLFKNNGQKKLKIYTVKKTIFKIQNVKFWWRFPFFQSNFVVEVIIQMQCKFDVNSILHTMKNDSIHGLAANFPVFANFMSSLYLFIIVIVFVLIVFVHHCLFLCPHCLCFRAMAPRKTLEGLEIKQNSVLWFPIIIVL